MPGGIDLKAEVLNSSACTLCGACLDWCPYLRNLEDRLVMPFDCNIKDGRCYQICPRTLTDWQVVREKALGTAPYNPELGAYTAIYRTKSATSVNGQQDGGTVSILTKTALEDNLVENALLTGSEDNITPYAFWGDTAADIEKAAGSRFLAAPGLRKIAEAAQQGIHKMLVIGRPCQIQALRKYQNYNDSSGIDIISIGLFCMWSLSWSFKDYLQTEYPDLKIEKITIPQHGVEVLTSDGPKVLPTEKVKEFIRSGCNYCLDMTSELADISVGAYEAEAGWNTVIIRSPQGAALLQSAVDKGYLILEEYPVQELQGLKRASVNKKARNLKLLQAAVDNAELKAFVDLSHLEYKEILSCAEGMVKS